MEAMATTSSWGDAVLVEVKVLLHGLWTAVQGDAKGLPSDTPKFSRDATVFCIFAAFFLAFNWGLRCFVIEPFLKQVLRFKGKMKQKYAQSAMEMIFYGGFTVLGCLVVPRQEWIWPSSAWWNGFSEGGHEIMRSDLRCYYIMYGARYFQGGISVFLEHRRKDFWEMQIHHWTTVALVIISYFAGLNHIGACVMLLLDPADAILHMAKMCKYNSDSMSKEMPRKGMWQSCADVLFAMFAVVFFVTRLLMYPYVCWSAHFEATSYLVYGIGGWSCVVGLEILLVLQCYWFSLLVRAVVNMFTTGGIEDLRSDDEDSEEMEKDPKKTSLRQRKR